MPYWARLLTDSTAPAMSPSSAAPAPAATAAIPEEALDELRDFDARIVGASLENVFHREPELLDRGMALLLDRDHLLVRSA